MISKKQFWVIRYLVIVVGLGILLGFVREWMGYEISSEAIADPFLAGIVLQIMYMVLGLVIGNVPNTEVHSSSSPEQTQ